MYVNSTRKIGVFVLVTVYLANLLYNITTTLIDIGSGRSQTLASRLASLSEAHMTYSKLKQHDTNSPASSGFLSLTSTRARKRLPSRSCMLDPLACYH